MIGVAAVLVVALPVFVIGAVVLMLTASTEPVAPVMMAAPILGAARALRLVPPRTAPSRDEFAAWRDDSTTRFVMAALQRNAEECREEWLRRSWDTGKADENTLTGLRERADALLGFTADYEAFCETLGLEPEQEEQAA